MQPAAACSSTQQQIMLLCAVHICRIESLFPRDNSIFFPLSGERRRRKKKKETHNEILN
jgi:hypothetical protein